jgi:uncharacterized protein (TIGR02594 family)
LSKPAVPQAHAPTRTELQRAAQLRHARDVRSAARRVSPAATTVALRRPVAAAYSVRPSDPHQRPMFGWPTLVTEARKYLGTNPTARSRLWCATFMNMVLAKTGYAGTGSDAAKSFASYGRRINEPQVGAIAVLNRGKNGGHVGIVTGIDANGNPIIISGNHGKRVGEGTYPRSRVIAYVLPTGRGPGTQLASNGVVAPRASDFEGGLTSPIDELLAAINSERASERRVNDVRPVARVAERMPERRQQAIVVAPKPRLAPYRVVQQVAAYDVPMPRTRVAEAHVLRDRASVPGTPMPRTRPAPSL